MLIAFDAGQLPDVEATAVSDHLSSCAGCESVVRGLQEHPPAGGDLGGRLRRCWLATQTPARDPVYAAMEAAAEMMGGGPPPTLVAGETAVAGTVTRQAVGPYLITGVIGQGGMGVVYRATKPPLNREVALKMIRAGAHARADTITRFRTEGEAIARLRHPNVVQIYDFDQDGELPYFTMELVENGSLAGKLAAGRLGTREAAELVRTLAAAVDYAHRRLVVHRDLKPGNVLLAADGTPKIADFGLARLLDDGREGLTQTDHVVGTPSYMAPEQINGQARDIGLATDVYALGTILYEAITGRPPFLGVTKLETMDQVRSRVVVPPSRLRPGLAPDLEAICLKCLNRVPARRYLTAQALARDLDCWLAGRPTVARPPGWGTRNRRRLLAAGAAATVGVMVACALAAASRLDPDRARREVEQALDERRPVALIRETGSPAYFDLRHGDESTKVATSQDGTFTVHSWSLCLLELVPDPRHARYRFRVWVRHERSDLSGAVGVYFARRAFPGPTTENHLFGGMTYNDVRSAADMAGRAPRDIAPRLQIPRENRVRIGVGIAGEQVAGQPWEVLPGWASGAPFQARGGAGDCWRELEIAVTPAGVSGRWAGLPVGVLSADHIERNSASILKDALGRSPRNPILSGVGPTYAPRGGLGLLVYRGSASFRSAEVAPLPEESQPSD